MQTLRKTRFFRKGKSRLPIEKLFGPAVPQMARNKETVRYIEKEAVSTYEKRLEHEIKKEYWREIDDTNIVTKIFLVEELKQLGFKGKKC